ncbi:MAG: BREX system P-loop protein BrxC [Selenomonadaceae bacterium]|nr:BREX system P-loop protein BrxC [Selenomonadaceae bacterium]
MIIEKMFAEDINRKINGVVKVEQDEHQVLVQELDEYIITKELKKHFIDFFNNYGDSFKENTSDIGVWISGFFGSGKSHFLKILSYLLENKEVQGIKTVERFRKKFEDDAATFMMIDNATRGKTDTILFNIDVQSSGKKDETAVLRVFAKMFYNCLGFYGEDLKVAKLEQFIAKKGKTKEFHRVFEEKNGESWLNSRDSFAFFEDDMVYTLQKVLGMSENAAKNWFNGTETVDFSIDKLVSEIKEYVDAKPKDFRLLFMADEVGQFVGDDRSLLLNLQSLVETIGSQCHEKVWVVCTGQEAIDEVIKARENEFSRIQARFKTRLSLSSSSADEVIQKRILKKTPEAANELETLYKENDSVLRNLFTFTDSVGDIKGYNGASEFTKNFPFVPYQFILMQKVFAEIRKHGNSGKHLSGGERSMLSGFQEAAQKIEDKNEYALAPFYLFYDTVHTFLDSSIRRVIERAERAADSGSGLEPQDVAVLKLLYLVRYVDDVKANLDNIVILMADKISLDKISMREIVGASLERLFNQNYIGQAGDVYNFLTDEEQDIQREIYKTVVDSSEVVSRIGNIIFTDIYESKKYRYGGNYDFFFNSYVDNIAIGSITSEMNLKFLTVATDMIDKSDLRLTTESKGQALVKLGDTPYYQYIENAQKIYKYVKQKNVPQLPETVQIIIRHHQEEARKYESDAKKELIAAIETAEFYVDGEHLSIKSGDAKSKINQALEYLVTRLYYDLNLIKKNAEKEEDISSILMGREQSLFGVEANSEAAVKVEEYLEMQYVKNIKVSMSDIQSRYKAAPYGWKEFDIACVVAQLIHDQKVTVKYNGETIQPSDPNLPEMLHKKTQIGKTIISKRQAVSMQKIRTVRGFLRDYFDEMDVPEDEDGLIEHIVKKIDKEKTHYENLLSNYIGHKYPDKLLISSAVATMKDILSKQKDNTALIDYIIKKQDEIYDIKEAAQNVEAFFDNQRTLFDEAVKYEQEISIDVDYIKDDNVKKALNLIRAITLVSDSEKFNYSRLPQLNGLMATVHSVHDKLLSEKRDELLKIAEEYFEEISQKAGNDRKFGAILTDAKEFFERKRDYIGRARTLNSLGGQENNIWHFKDEALSKIEELQKQTERLTKAENETAQKKEAIPKKIKSMRRMDFPRRKMTTEADIDAYVESIRKRMKEILKDCDEIQIE